MAKLGPKKYSIDSYTTNNPKDITMFDKQSSNVSIFVPLLAVSFIVLKLCNIINWSWWLVLLPIYGIPALILILIVLVLIANSFCRFALNIGLWLERKIKQ